MLVIQMEGLSITLTYSDLHERRFAFFQESLAEIGAQWSGVGARRHAGLNAGVDYVVGTARFDCADLGAADAVLEGLGSRIVFLIDWNRARKRLEPAAAEPLSVAVLTETAHREAGHMGWPHGRGRATGLRRDGSAVAGPLSRRRPAGRRAGRSRGAGFPDRSAGTFPPMPCRQARPPPWSPTRDPAASVAPCRPPPGRIRLAR
ncbi:hypothetical protein ACVOMV_07395 [Mesorhizobium atlanticum]